MPFYPRRIAVLAGLLFALSTVHCQAIDLPSSQHVGASDIQGWPEQERQRWYHTSAGTQLIPYDWFVALIEDESILDDFATTGILRDPSHPDKLPVGFAKVEGGPSSPAMVGFTCAFCHTTEFRYNNQPIRIEGGPSLQYNSRFLQLLLSKLGELNSPDKFKTFAARVLARRGEAMTTYT
ncbi:MAG: hypothetical protein WBB60_10760, partial [Nitrospira sp.]